MKRILLLSITGLMLIGGIVAISIRSRKVQAPAPRPAIPVEQPVASNTPAVAAEPLPVGWRDFRKLSESAQLNRITAAMEDHALPADVLVFFEREIFNRRHLDVTRNNMANALVWQEKPNPRLHAFFIQMLQDETESPAWRDYCLQFMSECLKSSSEPDLIKTTLAQYAKGKDGLAGTAIVHIGLQEREGRLQPDETFSRQLETQLADPEVATVTKISILGVLGKRQDVRLLPLVRTYAKDSNDGLRRCAMATLGLMGGREDLSLIRPGLEDRNRAVQLAAKAAEARILARFPTEEK
jgi:hypothetical protein